MSHSITRLVTELVEAEFPTPAPSEVVTEHAQDTLRDVMAYQTFVAEHPEMVDDVGIRTLLACVLADAPAAGLSFDEAYEILAKAFGLPARVQ